MQQHQRQQPGDLHVGQQLVEQATQPNGLGAEVGAGQRCPGRCRIPFVEHQVDHPQHALQARRQFRALRHPIGQLGIADLRLGSHDALGDGAGRRQKGPGDLLGGQIADLTQGQRHATIGRQGRMAAGEDQPQTVVFHLVHLRRLGCVFQLLGQQPQRGIEARPPAQGIDGLEATGGHQPGARVVRNAIAWPLLQRGGEGVLQCFLGTIEITQQADQRGQDPTRFAAVDRLDLRRRNGSSERHAQRCGSWRKGRTSTQPRLAGGIFAAMASASRWSAASIR